MFNFTHHVGSSNLHLESILLALCGSCDLVLLVVDPTEFDDLAKVGHHGVDVTFEPLSVGLEQCIFAWDDLFAAARR